jgi:hypothetical protein
MSAFRDALIVCELKDLGFQSVPFTYDNRRSGRANVKFRLDRALADDRWRDLFSDATIVHLVTPCLDHCPLLVRMMRDDFQPAHKCKRYEIMWEREREHALPEVISSAWQELGPNYDLGDINGALKKVMDMLHAWGGRKFGNVTRELAQTRRKLEDLYQKKCPNE